PRSLPHRSSGFSLVELLLALAVGLGLSGAILQALLTDARVGAGLARVMRERSLQQRSFELVRGDLRRAQQVVLASGQGAACSLGGRQPVLQLRTDEGPITYSIGAPPSAIWRGQVLMRCGPAFGLNGEPSSGQAQNRVLIDALAPGGFRAEPVGPGLLRLQLEQRFEAGGVASLRSELQLAVALAAGG
ncbi:MAG: prepilin-type N-terminal cleavage/methylation domain-containing protein, partial [Cyanobacteriota bacterium]